MGFRDRIGIPRRPEERDCEDAGQVLQCQVDGRMGKLCLQNLSSHGSLVSSALLGWLQDPHVTPPSSSESRAPTFLPLPHLSSPYLKEHVAR